MPRRGWDCSSVPCSWVCRRPPQRRPVPVNDHTGYTLRSTPETVIWGYFAADIPPVLRIKSGQTVKIDTVSHGGVNHRSDPVDILRPGRHCAATECSRMRWTSAQKVTRPEGASAHILTGPIYIEEAAPGDMLEIRISRSSPASPTASTARVAGPACCRTSSRADAESDQVRSWRATSRCSPTTSRCRCSRSWASWRWRRHGNHG